MADSPVTLIQNAYEGFRRGDVPAVLAAWSPSIRWLEADGGPYAADNPYIGHDAVMQRVIGPIMAEWPDFAIHPDEFVGTGEIVVVIGTYRGHHRTTGRELAARFAHVWHVRDGQAVTFEQITDNKKWFDAAGAVASV